MFNHLAEGFIQSDSQMMYDDQGTRKLGDLKRDSTKEIIPFALITVQPAISTGIPFSSCLFEKLDGERD